MSDLALLGSTGVEKVDEIILGLVGLVELSLPERVRGYYLKGSYTDASAVSTSDIDMAIVSKGSLTEQEEERLWLVLRYCRNLSSLSLDVHPLDENVLFRDGSVNLKIGSLLMYGEDIREKVSLPSPESYTRRLMHNPYHFFCRVRGNPDRLIFPMNHPDPGGEFYGYDCRPMRSMDGIVRQGIKELVVSTGWAATALVAWKAQQFVGKKSDCVKLYRAFINDGWTTLLEDIQERCRVQWGYLIPEDLNDRLSLRGMCERALAFENHFLLVYRSYLLEQLELDDDAIKLFVVKRLGKVIYQDDEILNAVKLVEGSSNPELRQAAIETLRVLARGAGDVTAETAPM